MSAANQQRVVEVWQQGYTYREAGQKLNLSGERVRQIVRLNHELNCSGAWVGLRGPATGTYCSCVQKHIEGRKRLQAQALANPQIVTDYEAGMRVNDIAKKHGVSTLDLWQKVRTFSENSKAVRKTHMWQGNRKRRTSKEDLIDHIKVAATRLGHPPTRAEYDAIAKSEGWPSSQTVCIRFDYWATALNAAGLTPSSRSAKVSRTRADKHWTKERVEDALHYLYDQQGTFPAIAGYRELARTTAWLPSDQIVRRLASWPDMRVKIMSEHATWHPKYSQMELIDPYQRRGQPKKTPAPDKFAWSAPQDTGGENDSVSTDA